MQSGSDILAMERARVELRWATAEAILGYEVPNASGRDNMTLETWLRAVHHLLLMHNLNPSAVAFGEEELGLLLLDVLGEVDLRAPTSEQFPASEQFLASTQLPALMDMDRPALMDMDCSIIGSDPNPASIGSIMGSQPKAPPTGIQLQPKSPSIGAQPQAPSIGAQPKTPPTAISLKPKAPPSAIGLWPKSCWGWQPKSKARSRSRSRTSGEGGTA